MVDNITYLVGIHHTLGFYGMLPYDHVEENVVHKGIDHALEDFSLLTAIFKEKYVINDTPSQEIIVITLCHKTMVM